MSLFGVCDLWDMMWIWWVKTNLKSNDCGFSLILSKNYKFAQNQGDVTWNTQIEGFKCYRVLVEGGRCNSIIHLPLLYIDGIYLNRSR